MRVQICTPNIFHHSDQHLRTASPIGGCDIGRCRCFEGCSSDYDLSPQSDVVTVTNTYGSFTDERISTYHHCLPGYLSDG